MNETHLLDKTASTEDPPRFFFKEWNILFDTFGSQSASLVSRSHALNREINRIEPQSRTVDQLRRWIALMNEIIKERDILKEEIVLHGEKIEKRLRGFDVELGWRRGHEKALSQIIDGLKDMLQFYEEEELQRLQQEMESKTRMNEVSDMVSAPEPIDIALAETESSINALLSTYRKVEISSLNFNLAAQTSPAPSDAWPIKQSAFLAVANETKRARKDYVRTMKDEAEVRAMMEMSGSIGIATRDLYRNSSSSAVKENEAISAGAGGGASGGASVGGEQIPLDSDEDITPPTTTTTTKTRTRAKILIADKDDEVIVAGNSKYASSTAITARERPQNKALWSLFIPLAYILLILIVRGLVWIFSFFMAEAE